MPGRLLVLALGVAGVSACVGRPAERPRAPMLQPAVEMHVLLPLSGGLAARGEAQWEVVALAARRLNESRGPLERPLRPTIHDSGSTRASALAAAEALQEAGVSAFVAPAFPESIVGLQDLLDHSATLIVVPDARHLDPMVGGPSMVALRPPDALRGVVLVDEALRRSPAATTFASRRPLRASPSDAAAGAADRAAGRGLSPASAEDADLVVVQSGADPPDDLSVEVGGVVLGVGGAVRTWTDPALPPATLWNEAERATSATYDAVVALGRAVRVSPPGASAEVLRAATVAGAWEGMLGPTEFRRFGPREAWYGHVPEVR